MYKLSSDARGFVQGIAQYIKREGKNEKLLDKTRGLLEKVALEDSNLQVVQVVSGISLTDEEKKGIEVIISRLTGTGIKLECSVNPKILGGLVIHAGDWVIDTSIESQLKLLAESLTS